MAGNQLVLMIDAQVIGIDLQGEVRAGILGGHGVGVAVEGDAELAVGADRLDDADVVRIERQWRERGLLLLEQFRRRGLGCAVAAQIGHGVEPLPGRGIEQRKVGDFQAGKEVVLNVAHGIFDAAFLMGLADATGGDAEAIVRGEVLVARIEHRGFPERTLEHRGLQVVEHDFGGHAAKGR